MGLRGTWHLVSPPKRQLLVLGHPEQQGSFPSLPGSWNV